MDNQSKLPLEREQCLANDVSQLRQVFKLTKDLCGLIEYALNEKAMQEAERSHKAHSEHKKIQNSPLKKTLISCECLRLDRNGSTYRLYINNNFLKFERAHIYLEACTFLQ